MRRIDSTERSYRCIVFPPIKIILLMYRCDLIRKVKNSNNEKWFLKISGFLWRDCVEKAAILKLRGISDRTCGILGEICVAQSWMSICIRH